MNIYSIKNTIYQLSFDDENVIERSLVFKNIKLDFPDCKEFYISDSYSQSVVESYIKLVSIVGSFVGDNDEEFKRIKDQTQKYLKTINMSSDLIKFIDYIDADLILSLISEYICDNNKKDVLENLNYDTCYRVYSYFTEYYHIPYPLAFDIYFYKTWLEKNLSGRFSIGKDFFGTTMFKLKDRNQFTLLIFEKNKLYLIGSGSIGNNNNNNNYYYYYGYYTWKVVKPLMTDKIWIEKLDKLFLEDKPNYINLNDEIISNYHECRGKFLQKLDDMWIHPYYNWSFNYIQPYNNRNNIIFTSLTIILDDITGTIEINLNLTLDDVKNLRLEYGIDVNESKEVRNKALWNLFKNMLIIDSKDKDKFQEIIDYFEN